MYSQNKKPQNNYFCAYTRFNNPFCIRSHQDSQGNHSAEAKERICIAV